METETEEETEEEEETKYISTMAYVYKHIRLDTNEVFYVGIGSDDSFKRAYTELGRNKFWQAVRDKSGFRVEIVKDGLTWKQACRKEKTLIKKYGRRDLGLGTLVNLTDGGEGGTGRIVSDEIKLKASERMKGKRYALGNFWSDEKRKKLSDKMKVVYWERLYDKEYENAKRLGFAK